MGQMHWLLYLISTTPPYLHSYGGFYSNLSIPVGMDFSLSSPWLTCKSWASCHCKILRNLFRIVQTCWPGGQVRTRTQNLLLPHLVLFLLFSFMYHSDLHLYGRALLSIRLNHKKLPICVCFDLMDQKHVITCYLLSFCPLHPISRRLSF